MDAGKTRKQVRVWLKRAFWPALVVLALNLEKLAEQFGWDQLLVRNWSPAMDSLVGVLQSLWFQYAAAMIAGAALALWLDGSLRRRDLTANEAEAKLTREKRMARKEERNHPTEAQERRDSTAVPNPTALGMLLRSLSRQISEETAYLPDGDLPTALVPLHSEVYAAMRKLNKLGVSTHLVLTNLSMRQQIRSMGRYFDMLYPLLLHGDVDGARHLANVTLKQQRETIGPSEPPAPQGKARD